MNNKTEYTLVSQNTEETKTTDVQHKYSGLGKRHIQAFCLFLSLSACLTARAQLSVSIVAMTEVKPMYSRSYEKYNSTEMLETEQKEILSNDNSSSSFPDVNSTILNNSNAEIYQNISAWSPYRTYNWSKSTQEMITTSFFIGYTSMQLPMGVISGRFGGKIPIMVALFVNAALSIITPWGIIVGWWVICIFRFIQGMTQAALYPGIQTMIARWAPISERGRLCSRIYTGSQFGTIVAFQLSGILSGNPTFGWPSSFWISGVFCLGAFVILAFFGAATPEEHPTIGQVEKDYINGYCAINLEKERTLKTPWKAILTSVPVWAMIICQAGSTILYIFLLIETPLYFRKILHLNIKNSGLFSSLPFIAMVCVTVFMGQLSDFFVNRKILKLITVRRIFNTIGMAGSGVLLIMFSHAEDVTLALVLLVLCVALHAGVQVGFLVNQIDLAPNFAGTLMALANLTANFLSLGVPVCVALVVKDVNNQSAWRTIFIMTAVVAIITNMIFVVFLKVDRQSWDNEDIDKDSTLLKEKRETSSTEKQDQE